MAIHKSLTKGVRRPEEIIKSQNTNSSIKKGNYKGDNDSEATSFTSSMHGSTSSATSSIDRYSSGAEGGIRQKKTLDKSNSKKINGFWSFRLSRIRPKSPLTSLPDDGSATTRHHSPVKVSNPSTDHFQKPVQKFTRSGSLRSLKILRNKNRLGPESNKSSNVEDLHSKKATFSSIQKDSKFPEQDKPQVGVKESEEVLPMGKLCPYQHCSLHGHRHHHHEPPPKRSYLKRRSSKDQKGLNSQTRTTDKLPGKKTEFKVTKKVSNKGGKGSKNEDVDFSIELYAKTRPEPLFEEIPGCDDVDLANIMFGVKGDNQKEVQNLQMDDEGVKDISGSNIEDAIATNDGKDKNSDGVAHVERNNIAFNNGNQMSLWQLIHQHMVSGLVGEPERELDHQVDEEKQSCKGADNHESEIRKMFAIKVVREAIEKILLQEVQDDQSIASEVTSEHDSSEKNRSEGEGISIPASRNNQNMPNWAADDLFGTKKEKSIGWSYVKKYILLKRFITELEKAKKFDPNKHENIPLVTESEPEPEPEPEAATVSLRRQTIGEKKNSDERMLDYALQQVVGELAPTQKRKVALLVKAFETVAPRLNDCTAKESSLNPDLQRVGSGVNGDYKQFEEKGVEGLDQEDNSNTDSAMNAEGIAVDVARGSEFTKGKYIKMWHMIYQHVIADIATKVGSELLPDGDESVHVEETSIQEVKGPNISNHRLGFSPRDADTLIRQSVNEIQVDASLDTHSLLETKEAYAGESQKLQPSKNWNKLRKLIVLRRSIKALERLRELSKPQTPSQSALTGEQEAEQVELRRQMMNERKKAEQWMLDYAVQHIATKLTPACKKRVAMLVEAFESVIPLPEI